MAIRRKMAMISTQFHSAPTRMKSANPAPNSAPRRAPIARLREPRKMAARGRIRPMAPGQEPGQEQARERSEEPVQVPKPAPGEPRELVAERNRAPAGVAEAPASSAAMGGVTAGMAPPGSARRVAIRKTAATHSPRDDPPQAALEPWEAVLVPTRLARPVPKAPMACRTARRAREAATAVRAAEGQAALLRAQRQSAAAMPAGEMGRETETCLWKFRSIIFRANCRQPTTARELAKFRCGRYQMGPRVHRGEVLQEAAAKALPPVVRLPVTRNRDRKLPVPPRPMRRRLTRMMRREAPRE